MQVSNICDTARCTGCGACMQKCPVNAVTMQPDKEGFLQPVISDKCIGCHNCEKVCPQNKEYSVKENVLDVYAVQHLDKKLLLQSTSGGVFILLSQYVIEKGGVVFGAVFDRNMTVRHTYAEYLEDVFPMQGSKYVQSDIGNTYKYVEEFLNNGRYVLFSGTPCQIEGLRSFLNKEYEKLILLDIVCGGVPSPLLFSEYINNIEKKNSSVITDYKFRDKKIYGCSHTTVIYETVKGNNKLTTIKDRSKVSYYNAFGSLSYMRTACYDCRNNVIHRNSDFTCSGYFGNNETIKKLGEWEGISQLLVHTEKGRNIFNELKHKVKYMPITIEDAKDGNLMLFSSVPMEKRCPEMYKYLLKYGYSRTSRKYFPESNRFLFKKLVPVRLKQLIKNILSRKEKTNVTIQK